MEFKMPMHLVAASITELSMILAAVCQTIGPGILMYPPCPNRANVLEFPGFSLRHSPFSFSSLYCAVLPSFFPLRYCGLHGTLLFPLYFGFYKLVYKLETKYPTFEHYSCWSNFVLNRTPKWVFTTTILKSPKGDCFRGGFGSL